MSMEPSRRPVPEGIVVRLAAQRWVHLQVGALLPVVLDIEEEMMGCDLTAHLFLRSFLCLRLHTVSSPSGCAEVTDVQTVRPGQDLLDGRHLGRSGPRLRIDLGIMPVQEWLGLLLIDQSVLGMNRGQHPHSLCLRQDSLQLLVAVLVAEDLAQWPEPRPSVSSSILPGPPLRQKSTTERCLARSSFSSKDRASSVRGLVLGWSTTVVMPPAAAAVEPLAQSSL